MAKVFYCCQTGEGDEHNLRFVNVRKIAATAHWFPSPEILNIYDEFLQPDWEKKETNGKKTGQKFLLKPVKS